MSPDMRRHRWTWLVLISLCIAERCCSEELRAGTCTNTALNDNDATRGDCVDTAQLDELRQHAQNLTVELQQNRAIVEGLEANLGRAELQIKALKSQIMQLDPRFVTPEVNHSHDEPVELVPAGSHFGPNMLSQLGGSYYGLTVSGYDAMLHAGSRSGRHQRTLARYRVSWHDYFRLLSAVRVDDEVTAMHAMHTQRDGLSRYLVVGDARGKLYFFRPHGEIAAEYDSGTGVGGVTALTSYQLRRNESVVLVGYSSGQVHILHVEEQMMWVQGAAEQLFSISTITEQASLKAPVAEPPAALQAAAVSDSDDDGRGAQQQEGLGSEEELHGSREGEDEGRRGEGGGVLGHDVGSDAILPAGKAGVAAVNGTRAISYLFSVKMGQRQQPLIVDSKGQVALLRRNHTMRFRTASRSPVMAMRLSGQHVRILNRDGLAVMMTRTGRMQQLACPGLNGSVLVHAAFDTAMPQRAYGVTADSELVVLDIGNDKQVMMCRVRIRRPVSVADARSRVAPLKGYLLLAMPQAITVLNTTSSHRSGPRSLLIEPMSGLAATFGLQLHEVDVPMIESNGEKMVAVSLGSGMVGVFHSSLPVQSPPEMLNMRLWSQPLFILAVVIIGIWQFYRAKRSRSPPPFSQMGSMGSRGLGGQGGGMRGLGASSPHASAFERYLADDSFRSHY